MPDSWPDDRPPWPLWVVPASILLGFVGGQVGIILVDVAGSIAGASLGHPTPAMAIGASIVFDLGFLGAALWLASVTGHATPADFGFRRVGWRAGVTSVAAAALGYYGLTAIYSTVLHLTGTDKLPGEFGVSRSTWALIGTAAFVCAVAPMAEEIFFRGFLFGSLRRLHLPLGGRELGPWVAAVVTGILFGLAHFDSAQPEFLIPLGFLGFMLCLVRWRTGSLYPGMALHSANNALALGVQLHWSLAGIVALIVASWALIAALVWPLGMSTPPLA